MAAGLLLDSAGVSTSPSVFNLWLGKEENIWHSAVSGLPAPLL